MFTQIEVRGPDAASFLQAQLTQDIEHVSDTSSPLAAWCTPKGRVVVVVRLLELPDGYGLVMPPAVARDVLASLQKYRLRAKVDLAVSAPSWQSLALSGDDDLSRLEAADLLPDARRDASRQRDGITSVRLSARHALIEVYGETEAAARIGLENTAAHSTMEWRAARIAAGIADIDGDTSGKFTPHMLNLDRLGAVSFDKGCYAGQEVIARTQHRGNTRRRLANFVADADVAPLDRLTRDGRDVGEVVAAAGRSFLALLTADAERAEVQVGNTRAAPLRA